MRKFKKALSGATLVVALVVLPGLSFGQSALEQSQNLTTTDLERSRNRAEQALPKPRDAGSVGQAPETVADSARAPDGAEAITFRLNDVRFNQSRVLSREDLDVLTAPYIGQDIAVSDLFKLTSEINDLYRKRGFITAQAILVPQDIQDGIVRVRLVESSVGSIKIKGTDRIKAQAVRGSVGLETGMVPTLERLENEVSAVNWNRSYNIAAALEPGDLPETTDIELVVQPTPKLLSGSAYIDNFGGETTGEINVGLTAQLYSLFGYGEEIAFGMSTAQDKGSAPFSSPEVNASFFNLRAPIPVWNGSINLLYSNSNSAVISGPFESLGIDGHGELVNVALALPFYSTPTTNLVLNSGVDYSKTRSTVGIVDTDTITHRFRLGLTGQYSNPAIGFYFSGGATAVHSVAKITGLSGRDTEVVNRLLLNVTALKSLTDTVSLQFDAAGQLADRPNLPSGEQWFIGGATSLPGYEPSSFGGDHGYYSRLGVNYAPNLGLASNSQPGLQSIGVNFNAFLGVGAAFDEVVKPDDRSVFYNAGLGLNFSHRNLTAKVEAAWPLDIDGHRDFSDNDPRILFSGAINF